MKKKKYNTTIPKYITFTFKILQTFSDKATVNFAKKLFITPIKYKIPDREKNMFENSKIEDLFVPTINKTIKIYHFGNQESNNKILLVHGWSGRGTQLVKIANNFKDNYHIISFDAPAHGLSSGKTTMMLEFVESIIEMDKKFGNFKFAIGHSLGGMSILNSINKQVYFDKIVLIGSGNSIKNIIKNYIQNLQIKDKYVDLLIQSFENQLNDEMEKYSSYRVAENISTPTLLIHDKFDYDVPVEEAYHLHNYLKSSQLIITENLGHRKILGDKNVINSIQNFLINFN